MENIFIELLPPWVETGLQPAFYDLDSGTVLQQTARMYAKVNELTGHVNEYTEKFTELYNYVHDYFDNLDVQEEVNNKLDEMVEDGTMDELIDEYLSILKGTYIIRDITFESGNIDGTDYYITKVPHLDSEGNPIVIQHGFAKNIDTALAVADDTAREFALRNYATFAVNGSIFGIDENEQNYGHAMGTIIKDGGLVSTYDTAGYTAATQARMRLLGVKSDGSLGTYPIDSSYATLSAAGIVNTFAGYGTAMENNNITFQFADEDGIWNFVCQNTTTKDLMFICCNGRDIQDQAGLTPRELLTIASNQGYDYAFAIDAGGSTCFVQEGIMVNMPYDDQGQTVRQTPDYIYFAKTPQTNIDLDLAKITADASDADINAKTLRNRVLYLQSIHNNYLDFRYPNLRHSGGTQNGVHLRYYEDGDLSKQLIFGTIDRPQALALYDSTTDSTLFRADASDKTLSVGGLTLADFFTAAQNITDYNDKLDSGIWRVGGNAVHKPWSGTVGGILICLKGVSGGTRQIAIPQVNDSTTVSWYTRQYNAGTSTFESWRVLLTPTAS